MTYTCFFAGRKKIQKKAKDPKDFADTYC